jgi:HEAT repeat protein
VADSYYWEAFARFREGGARQLGIAAELLRVQGDRYPDAGTRRDADALMVRIEAQQARRGNADAAAAIAETASGPCDQQQDVRLAALSALLNMNADQAVPILQEVLESRDACSVELRRRAVFLLSQKMNEESVDILLDLAHRNPDPDPEVREQAIFWLHQVDTPEALDALESILMESDDPEIQERAIFAISQRDDDGRAIAILKGYAERADVPNELRSNAIFWISQNPSAGGAQYLIDLYPRLDDAELKERAIFGISQAGGPEARGWLSERVRDDREDVEIRKNALFWLGQMGGVVAEDLQGLYETLTDVEMKEQVIFVASQSNDSGAVDFLMDVARTEEDQELKERAIFWLGQSNDPRVAEFLLTLIRGGTVRR